MYKILIADDEKPARNKLKSFLKSFNNDLLIFEAENGLEAIEIISNQKIDIVLLDIQMPGSTGIDVVRYIGIDNMPLTIFVTAFDQYAINAFEVEAVDYLLKPYDEIRLQKAYNRATTKIENKIKSESYEKLLDNFTDEKTIDKFIVSKNGKYSYIKVDKIYYISAEDKYVKLNLEFDKYLIRETIINLEQKLPNYFKRIHRSTIVNTEQIKEIQPESHGDANIVLQNNMCVKLSRNFRNNIIS